MCVGCCPYEGLALEAEKYQKTSATDNFSTVQNVTCAYRKCTTSNGRTCHHLLWEVCANLSIVTCTVSTKAAFDALKECVVGDKLNPPRVWRSSDTFPLCSFYEKEQKAASSANAVRFSWAAVIVGVLSFSIVLNGSS